MVNVLTRMVGKVLDIYTRYQRAAEYLCERINQMKVPAPSGRGTMLFEVKKTINA